MQVLTSLRASDSDREQVAERLRHATAEGRLSGDELAQRLDALYAARTYGELDALLADLPPVNRSPGQRRVRLGRLVGAASAVTLVLVVLGVLAFARVHTAVGVAGTGRVREVTLPGPPQGFIVAASLGAVVVVLLAAAGLLWALMASRSTRQP